MGARAYPEPGDTFGRYRIVRELGRGGYGSVLEARQLDLDRPVALKVLSPVLADEPQFRDRFAREAAMLAHLDSPHVIQVYEHGEQDGHLFIATQLVHGGDLKQLLRDTNGVSPATALDLAAQVASGLADAHDAGLIHRDIKPSNILVRRYGDGWFAYLCDFGIARATDSDYTRTGGVIGSLGYMAPERHQGADATIATDVYSLGMLALDTADRGGAIRRHQRCAGRAEPHSAAGPTSCPGTTRGRGRSTRSSNAASPRRQASDSHRHVSCEPLSSWRPP